MAGAVMGPIVVFDSSLYHGNGDVNVWMHKVAARMELEFQRRCPVRSGRLLRSIDVDTHTIGDDQIVTTLTIGSEETPYLGYHLGGTVGPIYSDDWLESGKRMGPIPVYDQGAYGRTHFSIVSGQKPAQWPQFAWRATKRAHRPLRGLGDLVI